MEKNKGGFILPFAETKRHAGGGEGFPGTAAYHFLGTATEDGRFPFEAGVTISEEIFSKHINLTLNTIQAGGHIEEHCHEYDAETPIFDHSYYIMSGRARVSVGGVDKIVGADTLMYFPSYVTHAVTNIGNGAIKLLRFSGSGYGAKMGWPVYSKTPSGNLGVHPWKLTSTLKWPKREDTRKGFILSAKEVVPLKAPDKVMVLNEKGQIKTVKREGTQDLLKMYPLLRPTAEFTKLQPEPSLHINMTLNKILPWGRIEEHYHEYNAEIPVFDHCYFVISGRMRATIDDMEKTVGAYTLIYCPSNVRHSLSNVGKSIAKYIWMGGTDAGAKMGGPVYLKNPA
jgi:mannose-6-phosphate isomerase-like protein (cupin superfamily)